VSTTTSKETHLSPSLTNNTSESPLDTSAWTELPFPVETDIIIHANGDVTIADLPYELRDLAMLLGSEGPNES
jgi:hypothetical protein